MHIDFYSKEKIPAGLKDGTTLTLRSKRAGPLASYIIENGELKEDRN